jgi:hypothetical protein
VVACPAPRFWCVVPDTDVIRRFVVNPSFPAAPRTSEDAARLAGPDSSGGRSKGEVIGPIFKEVKDAREVGGKLMSFADNFADDAVRRVIPRVIGLPSLLAPEPVGLLPERFLQDKLSVAGYPLSPLDAYAEYERREVLEKRAQVAPYQLDFLKRELPALSLTQLYDLRTLIGQGKPDFVARVEADRIVTARIDELQAAQRAVTAFDPNSPAAIADELFAEQYRANILTVTEIAGLGRTTGEILPPAILEAVQDIALPDSTLARRPDGTFDPAQVRALTATAIASERAKVGVNRELIHERADP